MRRLFLLLFLLAVSALIYSQDQIIQTAEYQNIQQAIDAAPSGAIVIIPAGEYYAHLEIDKPLTLRGAGSGQTILYYMDESLRQGHHRDIMDFADEAEPVIRIEQAGKVVLENLELRGATEGFSHFGYSSLGIVSKSTVLVLQNVVMRRFKNIYVWVDRGRLQVDHVVFGDNQGFSMQGDLGFHLTNVEDVTISNFRQETDQVDHAINFNDVPADDEIERTTRVLIEDSSILASSLYWGDCIRSYGGTDIIVRNTLFTRKPNGEPPRELANSGISLNGNRVTLLVDSCRFENLPDAIVLYTNRYGDQHYEVSVQNSSFSDSRRAYFFFAGEGSLELDLGNGPFSSAGENTFDPDSLMLRVNNQPDAVVYAPSVLAEAFEPFSVYSNDNGSEDEIVIQPQDNFVFNDNQMVRTDDQGQQYSYVFRNLTVMKALDLGTFVLTAYRNTEGTHFLGRFSPQLEFLNEYHFGHAVIRDIRGTSALILVRYLDAGYEYVGTFDVNLNYLGSYWFYQNARIADFGIRENRPFVIYDLESDSGTKRYTAFFDRNMNFMSTVEE